MIKTITKKVNLVICDICGNGTGYYAEQEYAKNDKHFCREHASVETTWEILTKKWNMPDIAESFFQKAKEQALKERK